MKATVRASQQLIDRAAADWIARRDAGLSATAKAEFDHWLADPRHAEALSRLSTVWSQVGRPRRTGASEAIKAELEASQTRRRRRKVNVGISSLVVMLLAGSIWWSFLRPVPAELPATAVVMLPHHETLPDGSLVESPADSVYQVDFSGALRRIHLEKGEALFTVTKDAHRPFVVESGGVEFRAIGTAFSVKLGSAKVSLVVTEGRVAVDHPAMDEGNSGRDPLTLATSQTMVVVDAGKQIEVNRIPTKADVSVPATIAADEVATRLAWRNPRVEFSGAPLHEVIEILNRYNAVQFVIDDKSLSDVTLSGLFRADDTATFQSMMETAFGMETERRGNLILLRKARR